MTTPADLNTRLAKLREIRASGVLSTEVDGQKVVFRSDQELASAIADLERQIRALSIGRVTTIRLSSSKGF